WGLALAAATPGMVTWAAMPLGSQSVMTFSIAPAGHGAVVKYGPAPVQVKAPKKAGAGWETMPPPAAALRKLAPPPWPLDGAPMAWRPGGGLVTGVHQRPGGVTVNLAQVAKAGRWLTYWPPKPGSVLVATPGPPAGFVRSWLLVPLALLMV